MPVSLFVPNMVAVAQQGASGFGDAFALALGQAAREELKVYKDLAGLKNSAQEIANLTGMNSSLSQSMMNFAKASYLSGGDPIAVQQEMFKFGTADQEFRRRAQELQYKTQLQDWFYARRDAREESQTPLGALGLPAALPAQKDSVSVPNVPPEFRAFANNDDVLPAAGDTPLSNARTESSIKTDLFGDSVSNSAFADPPQGLPEDAAEEIVDENGNIIMAGATQSPVSVPAANAVAPSTAQSAQLTSPKGIQGSQFVPAERQQQIVQYIRNLGKNYAVNTDQAKRDEIVTEYSNLVQLLPPTSQKIARQNFDDAVSLYKRTDTTSKEEKGLSTEDVMKGAIDVVETGLVAQNLANQLGAVSIKEATNKIELIPKSDDRDRIITLVQQNKENIAKANNYVEQLRQNKTELESKLTRQQKLQVNSILSEIKNAVWLSEETDLAGEMPYFAVSVEKDNNSPPAPELAGLMERVEKNSKGISSNTESLLLNANWEEQDLENLQLVDADSGKIGDMKIRFAGFNAAETDSTYPGHALRFRDKVKDAGSAREFSKKQKEAVQYMLGAEHWKPKAYVAKEPNTENRTKDQNDRALVYVRFEGLPGKPWLHEIMAAGGYGVPSIFSDVNPYNQNASQQIESFKQKTGILELNQAEQPKSNPSTTRPKLQAPKVF